MISRRMLFLRRQLLPARVNGDKSEPRGREYYGEDAQVLILADGLWRVYVVRGGRWLSLMALDDLRLLRTMYPRAVMHPEGYDAQTADGPPIRQAIRPTISQTGRRGATRRATD